GLQPVLGLPPVVRILNRFTGRERGEVFQSDINPHGIAGWGQRFGFGQLTDQEHKPAVGAARDAQLLDRALNRATESHAHSADAGHGQLIALERAASDTLDLLAEGVVTSAALESGEARFLALLHSPEESLERLVEFFQRVLLNRAQASFDFGKLSRFGQ